MLTIHRPPVLAVVQQHQEEAACLRSTREVLVGAPHVRLHHLRRCDDRIAAHLDGLAVAGELGSRLCEMALSSPGVGEVFAATVRAIEDRNARSLARLLSLAEAEPAAETGLISGFGWVSAGSLRGITRELLASRSAFQRQVGLAACGMHQVDPGPALPAALNDRDALLRRRALRVAGELGRRDALPACLHALSGHGQGRDADADPSLAFVAARSALLLGERDEAVASLYAMAAAAGPLQNQAIDLLLKVLAPSQAHAVLKQLAKDPAKDPARARALLRGVGVAGDVQYLPWLIEQMADPNLARPAGEAFSTVTGLDLAFLDLDTRPLAGQNTGPTDDPADADVAMDEDDSLPWPDPAKLAHWWRANGPGFQAGARIFMGQPPSAAHCAEVLKSGFQRQRAAAALYLRLLKPGQPLFNTAAPAWRQQRLLAGAGL